LLCGATAELQTEKYPGYQEPETFAIYYCPTCNTSFSSPRVDTRAIYNLIYSKGAEVVGYDRYWRYKELVKTHPDPLQFLYEAEESYWAPITALKKIVSDKHRAKILEVGCGMGYLTYSLIRAGYNSTGLDISQDAVTEANRSFGNHYICADLFAYAEEHKNEYDVVIMTEVIEHVESPTDFLRYAAQMVKEGGAIFVTTPNKTIYSNAVVWETDLPPVHCWWLSEDSMTHIAGKIGCEVDFVDFSDYYRKAKHIYAPLTNQLSVAHRFKENGEITPTKSLSLFKKGIRLVVTSKIYKRIKSRLFPDKLYHYECKKRGLIICAVYKKSATPPQIG
jgi:SAM-dependent methyltransferase